MRELTLLPSSGECSSRYVYPYGRILDTLASGFQPYQGTVRGRRSVGWSSCYFSA